MVFLLFIVIGIVAIIVSLIIKQKLASVISLIFLILSIIIPFGIYSGNIGTIANLEAFYNASATNFEITRDDTASYLSESKIESNITLIPITGSIERVGIGANVATRVLEYRNAVNAYNSAFAQYKAYKSSVLYGLVYPSIPSQMKMLVINPVDNGSPNNYSDKTIIMPNTPGTGAVPKPTIQKKEENSVTKEQMEQAIQDAIKSAVK